MASTCNAMAPNLQKSVIQSLSYHIPLSKRRLRFSKPLMAVSYSLGIISVSMEKDFITLLFNSCNNVNQSNPPSMESSN